MRRRKKTIADVLSPMPSHLLNISLSDFIPPECDPPHFNRRSPRPLFTTEGEGLNPQAETAPPPLPQSHHLVHFPPQMPASALLPDGTDPAHSPGAPFERRMWAGGSVSFAEGWDEALVLDGRAAVCAETIGDVTAKGPPGAEKIFVDVWRRYGLVGVDPETEDVGPPMIEERRSLVFMRPKTPEEAREDLKKARARVVKAPYQPSYSIELIPSATLLFHFSALTYNAHSIHFDPSYCRETEGHRGLLVHGPLSLTLMFSALHSQLRKCETVERIDYRNLAPLYAGEPMRVCLRRSTNGDGEAAGLNRSKGSKWDVWAEGPDGSLAVRGVAVTRRRSDRIPSESVK